MGRMVRDAEVRTSQDGKTIIARFTLAVDRKFNKEEQSADFISCIGFNKKAEFLEKHGKQGTKFVIEGRIQTGSYTNKDNQKVYTTDVLIEQIEFAESKKDEAKTNYAAPAPTDGFMNIPDGIDEAELPFV